MASTHRDQANERRKQRLDRITQVSRDDNERSHPSWGGSCGYDIFHRRELVDSYQNGRPVPTRVIRSIQRWIRNGVDALMPTGNKGCYNLSGEDLLLLVLYKLIWPHAINVECIAFIANNSTEGKIYSEKDVSKALVDLGYSRKVTSTVAY